MAIVIHNLRPAPNTHISAVHRHFFAANLSSGMPRRFNVRANLLPFPEKSSKYYKHLEAAVEVVQRASHLCVDVKSSLFSTDDKVLEKNDNTPVTVADFGVQALLSLELNKLFPDIPLVAEEDSAFLRSRNLAGTVLDAVTAKASSTGKPLTQDDVLEAIDRGGKDASVFGSKPATYWVLDPIDGTRGFLKASKSLYVVGLALVVEGEVVIGVMGCPNWQEDLSEKSPADMKEHTDSLSGSGIVMIAHIGCGTWTKSQTWESLPLSSLYNATSDADNVGSNQILILTACCGSLCKYLMVASGRASIFMQRKKEKTTIKSWDHAVGMLCVHEAGGKVSDWEGSEIDLAADESERRVIFPSGGVLVTNGTLHHNILHIISQTSTL
ncbi:putative phosphoric monoester hydrolase [Lupinus albus]|uniref:Putative phosphoric monoester hydrolase n=1 Tax=Lupinus albus TaxID=3870 RepID=A0A6A4NRH1_LUPAL|nr:putative phosphoric monoester hydrolase [Lupinus albus]